MPLGHPFNLIQRPPGNRGNRGKAGVCGAKARWSSQQFQPFMSRFPSGEVEFFYHIWRKFSPYLAEISPFLAEFSPCPAEIFLVWRIFRLTWRNFACLADFLPGLVGFSPGLVGFLLFAWSGGLLIELMALHPAWHWRRSALHAMRPSLNIQTAA